MSTHWPDASRDLESLREEIGALTKDVHLARTLIGRAITPGAQPPAIQLLADAWNIRYDVAADWPRLSRLQQAEVEGGASEISAEAPLSSVHHAAWFIQKLELGGTLDNYCFYRGQRDHRWRVTPKVFRSLDAPSSMPARAELDRRLQQIREQVALVRAAGLADDDFDALAIVQHYSGELGVGTWLVDVTNSPWVALFFASDGGRRGDLGVVELISRREWDYFSARGRSQLGALRVATISNVPRIDGQAAMFLQAPHPDLFEELTNLRIHFRQGEGEAFATSSRRPPVHRASIYPEKDAVLDALRRSAELPRVVRPLAWEPAGSLLDSPGADDYVQICEVMVDDTLRKFPDLAAAARDVDWSEALAMLADFHAKARAASPRAVSLHHLRRAVERMVVDVLKSNG